MASPRSNPPEHGNEGASATNEDGSSQSADRQQDGTDDEASAFIDQNLMEEMNEAYEARNASSLPSETVGSSRKRKGSRDGKDTGKRRKRSRGASFAVDSRDTSTESTSGKSEAKEGSSERVVTAALMARTSEQNSLPIAMMHPHPLHTASFPTAEMGAVQHAPHQMHHQQQMQTAISQWSQLSPSMQSALLSSAAASVGPVFPGPPHLASLLSLQQAGRLAASQFIATNPFAGQMLLQQLMAGNPAMPAAIPMIPPNFGTMFSPWPGLQSAAAVGLPPFALQAANFQHMQIPQVPYTAGLSNRGGLSELPPMPAASPAPPTYTAESIGPDVPEFLPAVLALPEDESKLSAYQILLRRQIEAFSATADDLSTHARGRNKPITLRQVGIRCRHCSHIALNRRKKGSAYFPFSLLGLYQAAQNMGSSHFHGESCSGMSDELKDKFVESISSKSTVGSGKLYWAQSARKIGLVDTEHGIRFIRDLVAVVST